MHTYDCAKMVLSCGHVQDGMMCSCIFMNELSLYRVTLSTLKPLYNWKVPRKRQVVAMHIKSESQ